jgi:hypothetical protein
VHACEPRTVGGGIGDRGGTAVRVGHHERAAVELPGERLERVGHRLQREAERADVQERDVGGERGERVGGREPGHRRPVDVEAISGAAAFVELDQRERRRVVGAHVGVEPHAVGGELAGEPGAEAVGRDPAQVRDRAIEPAERAGGVEGSAPEMRRERVAGCGHEVDQRLPGDDDEPSWRHERNRTVPVAAQRVLSAA